MKANEIKINNWINYNSCNLKINSIIHPEPFIGQNYSNKWLIAVDNNCLTVTLDKINPIPLSEEWLTNLGAKKYKKFIIHDRFVLQWINGHNYWYVTDANFQSYITKIEFVHEWQNLFFELTKKELTL